MRRFLPDWMPATAWVALILLGSTDVLGLLICWLFAGRRSMGLEVAPAKH